MTIQVEFKAATTAADAHSILSKIRYCVVERTTNEVVISALISPAVYNVASVTNQIATSATVDTDIVVSCDEWADVRGFTIKR